MAKKLLALVLALVMVLSMAACGGSASSGGQSGGNDGDMITLTWWYPGPGGQPDTQMVNDAFNELLHTFPGFEKVNIKFHEVATAEYATALTLGISAKEPMDIINTSYYVNYQELVQDGSLMDITQLLEKYPDLKNEFPEWLWDYMEVKGKYYSVPNYQRASNKQFFYTPTDYMDRYGDYDKMYNILTNPDSTVTEIMEMMEEYVLAIREGEGETKYMKPYRALGTYTYDRDWRDMITGQFALEYGSTEVTYLPIRPESKESYEIAARWYKEGIYTPDEITAEDIGGTLASAKEIEPISYVASCNNGIGTAEQAAAVQSIASGYSVTAIPLAENYFVKKNWDAGGNAIAADCEHPEEALAFLELLNTEEGKELYNMLVYGIEDVHWEFVEGNYIRTYDYDTAQAFTGARYGTYKWAMGNTFYAYENQGCADNENEMSKQINENPDNVVSELIGFIVDTSQIETELAQINTVYNEYYNMLVVGAYGDDWENQYNNFLNKLEAAGIQKCLDILQKQVDEHLAKN